MTDERHAPDEGMARRAMRQRNAIIGGVLFVLIVLMVNYLSFRHYVRWDWTEDSLFTLSQRSEEVLRRLEGPVEIYIFLSEGEESYDALDELAARYRTESSLITIHRVDPDREPSEYQALAQRFELTTYTSPEGGPAMSDVAAVVTAGERRWKIGRDDLLSPDFDSLHDPDGPKIDVTTEQALTGAIVEVTSGTATRICVSTGHGEFRLEGGGARSLRSLRDDLERQNIDLEPLEFLGATAVPLSCDAVFVIAPQRAFSRPESDSLEAYLEAGGSLLLSLEPEFGRRRSGVEPTGLEGLASELGITIDASLLLELDPARVLANDPMGIVEVVDFGEHPLLAPIRAAEGVIALSSARSVRVSEGSAATTLFSSSRASHAVMNVSAWLDDPQPDPAPGDIRGPVSIGAAASLHGGGGGEAEEDDGDVGGGRLVVIGDADWLVGDLLMEPRLSNIDLLGSITGWLTKREALIAIAPRQVSGRAVMMTEESLGDVAFRVIGLMPGAFLLMGFAVWWSRRA